MWVAARCQASAAHLTEICSALIDELENIADLPQVAVHFCQGVQIIDCPVAKSTLMLVLQQNMKLVIMKHVFTNHMQSSDKSTATCLFRSVYSLFHSLRFLASTLA